MFIHKPEGERIMRTSGAALLLLTLVVTLNPARAQVQAGISIGEEGIRSFYLAVGEYFRTPEKEVVVVRQRGIPDEEIPVVMFLAARANVAPGVIIDLRLGGMTWTDICVRHKLSPEIFYVPVRTEVSGPPYGKAYGYYKNKPRNQWKNITLSDADIVNLVNLRFVSEHYGYPPAQVIKMRSEGKTVLVVHEEVRKGKKGKPAGEGKKGKGKKNDSKK